MTRINCGISPLGLTDQHLLAEIRELPRIVSCVLSNKYTLDNIPSSFRLGAGHVKFFCNKIKYLEIRYNSLLEEYAVRFGKGLESDAVTSALCNFKASRSNSTIYNDYNPTKSDKEKLVERISTRITESKQIPRWYKE